MHYITRTPERTAFLVELAPYVQAGKVTIHHDGGDPKSGPDIRALLANFEIGTHLYYCGPPGFMNACAQCTEAWPPHAIHREYFASAGQQPDASENVPFKIKIKSSGKTLSVPADRTIADVLREAGCVIDTDCEDGYCGTCITRYLSGEPEHRDTVLSEKERQNYVMVCCARAKGGVIELDL
jgi:vanillate O-demethylase ferredoxin subunit